MTSKFTKRKTGFRTRELRKRKGPGAVHYLSKPVTFWIAVMSIFAFVSGNIIGQHGFYVFLSSIWARVDDSLIVYDGAVSPIALIPDPVKWAEFGGDYRYHTYSEAPMDTLIPLPSYIPVDRIADRDAVRRRIYSVDFGGTYETGGGMGSHAGIDIAAPRGTPVRAVMNAYVIKAGVDAGGFGNYVLLYHPNVPDPKNPGSVTTLYTVYAHLDSMVVETGMLLKKGDVLGAVGKTGDASGYHLHFAMENKEAPSHTYWPFTWTDLKAAGMSFSDGVNKGLNRDKMLTYMENPMLYVQAQYTPLPFAVVKAQSSSSSEKKLTLAEIAEQRRKERLVKAGSRIAIAETPSFLLEDPPVAPLISFEATSSSSVSSAQSSSSVPVSGHDSSQEIAEIVMDVPYDFTSPVWQTMRVFFRDKKGDKIENPVLSQSVRFRTGYGSAQFKPDILTAQDFKEGVAEVQIRPMGQTTVVIEAYPFSTLSRPIRYAGR